MTEGDEQVNIDADDVQIDAKRVIVSTGWTARMAFWNTLGTVVGAFSGVAALVLSAVAIWVGFH
jgi:hypothetical protein